MKIPTGMLIIGMLFSTNLLAASIDPSKLIKVTGETNPKCVEYYNYKGQMFCSTTALSPEPNDPNIKNYEKQKLVFDNRVWKAAWGKQTEGISMVEYVPNGDDVEHWNELVTSQFIPNTSNISPKELADKVIQGIREAGFSPVVKFYDESGTQVTFEFRILSPNNQVQDELQIIKKGKAGFYITHYVIKKSDMGDKNRDVWLENLRRSSIK